MKCFLLTTLLVASLIKESRGLRNVTLLVMPPVVERGKTVQLLCQYDLQGAPLYAIKFYRGTHEFYRYSPLDNPAIKLFPFRGLEVDLSSSQGSSVVIQNTAYSLEGNISCEVSTDAPYFSTMITTKYVTVVELPKKPPDIKLDEVKDGEPEAGDWVRATCTSSPARPAPSLTWFINDEPAMTTSTRWQPVGLLEDRSVTLTTRLLARHVTEGHVVLKCTAMVLDVYKETAIMVLGSTSPGEPKHERVRVSDSSPRLRSFGVNVMMAIVVLVLAMR